MMVARMAAGVALAGLAMAVAACDGDGGGSGGDDVYRVLVLGGLTAEGAADNAASSVQAAQAGFDHVNETGGIDGRQVVVTVVDDQGDPTRAVSKVREAVVEARPDFVLISGPSTIADATPPILKQDNILSFNSAPTKNSSDPEQFSLNFDFSPGIAEFAGAFVPYTRDEGYRKVWDRAWLECLRSVDGGGGQEGRRGRGPGGCAMEEYDVAALDMTAQLETIRSKNPDVLFSTVAGRSWGSVLRGVEKLGWGVRSWVTRRSAQRRLSPQSRRPSCGEPTRPRRASSR